MKKIELEQGEPFPGDPRRMQYAGQRVAQEVFEELKHRLESMGYLPDEYFLMDREWENGREIPKDADIFCTTDYGGNEGVYLDVYLKWYEDSRPVTKSFITGKTLGETGADLDRMFLISSAITKAFHGDGETYARHLRQGERAEPEGMIVHLNPTEQRTIIEALVEQQERQEQAMSQTEQLLRRMTGSIPAYMDEVGRYPLHISDYDKTVLAIRDGEFDAFKNLYPRVSDQTDDLLIEVAGRPGVVGGNMTLILLAAVERFSPEAYLTACKRAVETGDSWRVQTLVKESEGRLSEPLPSLHGEVILYAYTNNCRNIAKDLIAQCTPEQIVVGAGIEYLLGCLAHLFSDGMAAIENPGYFRTRTVLQNSGIPCTLVDIDREGLPADALEKSGANLCYLTPSHHFPTGVTMPATRRAQLLAWAAARPGRYILEDDYDSEFRFDTRPLPSLQGMAGPDGPVVYLTTFSKSLAPGIRIACMVLPQSLLARYRRDFATYANTVSRFEQQTLCEFMAGGYFTRHLARMRLAYKRRMEAFAAALRAALPGVELDGVHSGLHFLLTLPGAGGERAMVAAAAQQGVRLRGLSEYYLARPELCRADTVVAGYSALKEDDVEKVAQALARAWLS